MSTVPSAPARTSGPVLGVLRVTALLSVLVLAWQFVTAGQLFGPEAPVRWHQGGAIVLHVVTGATAVAALAHQRGTRGAAWPVLLAAAVFAATFVQAASGGSSSLWVHVPGAMVVTVGAVWVLAWSSTGVGRASRSS